MKRTRKTISFAFEQGDIVRFVQRRWRVVQRRWTEREVCDAVHEYLVVPLDTEGGPYWAYEPDLTLEEP
jgi:hypothetical protein